MKDQNTAPCIYMITALRRVDPHLPLDTRAMGYYFDNDTAVNAVLHNVDDIHEDGFYPFVVIEKIYPGLYPIPDEDDPDSESWFFWDKIQEAFVPTVKPVPLLGRFGFFA